MTITTGEYTIGSGGDYATPNTAIADIDPTGPVGAGVVLRQIESVVETAARVDTLFPLNGSSITLINDAPPLGVFGDGHTVALQNDIKINTTGAGTLTIDGMQPTYGSGFRFVSIDGRVNGGDLIMRSNMIDATGPHLLQMQAVNAIGGGGVTQIYNNVHANSAYGGNGNGFNIQNGDNELQFFGNTSDMRAGANLDGFQFQLYGIAAGVKIANNVALVNSGRFGYEYTGTDSGLIAGNYMHNNASTDLTSLVGSTDPISGITPADEFTSDVFGEVGYLQPADGSLLALAGTATNSPTTVDITGATYGANPPIGAYIAFAVAATPPCKSLFFRIFQHLLPKSRPWNITPAKQLREFFFGLTDVECNVKEFSDLVYLDLFPQSTRELAMWETQFNLLNANNLTEQERRDRLEATWQATGGQSPRYLQDLMQANGFDVYVHDWWVPPDSQVRVPRDPNTYLVPPAYLLVNKVTESARNFLTEMNDTDTEMGEAVMEMGEFSGFIFSIKEYTIPADPALWPYFAYVGGEIFPNLANVPASRRDEFETLLLKYFPGQLWLGVLVNYV